MTDEEFAEAVRTSAASQLRRTEQHYPGLIDGSIRREGLDLVFEFEASKRPGITYAHRAGACPGSGERRDADGVAGVLVANWMEIVAADDVVLPDPSGDRLTWLDDQR